MKCFATIASVGVMCLTLLSGGISYSASDIPALRDAKDATERARVQALIDGARKENVLDWTGIMIEPKHANRIIPGFKEYYGLPDLKVNYTYGNSTEVISRVNQVVQAGRTPPDIVWLVGWDWFTDLVKQGKLMRYESPYYKEYTLSNKAGNSMPGYWVSDAYTNNPMWNVKELEKRGVKIGRAHV
jgi:ABC-type glycerol-3-phosphate transport system substrate-binding protein